MDKDVEDIARSPPVPDLVPYPYQGEKITAKDHGEHRRSPQIDRICYVIPYIIFAAELLKKYRSDIGSGRKYEITEKNQGPSVHTASGHLPDQQRYKYECLYHKGTVIIIDKSNQPSDFPY